MIEPGEAPPLIGLCPRLKLFCGPVDYRFDNPKYNLHGL
jgi:hypothetical protein